MNYRILALIGVRLLAIYLIVIGIRALAMFVTPWGIVFTTNATTEPASEAVASVVVLVATVVPLILGLCLWAFAPWVSRRMAPTGEHEAPAVAAPVLVQGAIAIAGLVIVVTTLPSLIYSIIVLIWAIVDPHNPYYPNWPTLAERAALVLFGLALVVGARRLRDWIFRLRTAAT